MEYKLSQHETKANVPEVNRRGSQGLSCTLVMYNLGLFGPTSINDGCISVNQLCALTLTMECSKIAYASRPEVGFLR